MHRRTALQVFARSAGLVALGGGALAAAPSPPNPQHPQTGLGLVAYCRSLLRKQRLQAAAGDDLYEPLTFLNHARELGAGGVQVALGRMDAAGAAQLRQASDAAGMFLEGIISLPKEAADLERFRAEMQTAREAGARAVRCTLLPGRRYEQFQTLADFQAADRAGREALERAAPIAEQFRLPLALENHKDHRDAERVRLFEAISSEYVGACVDTGNSIALLEDPLETVRAFAPWAQAVHLKDQALAPCAEGFLLADIPLGEGALDLAAMMAILRKAKPGLPMCLELITRDPLRVPCLTDAYWATFPDLPGRDLARTLRLVHERTKADLPNVSSLALADQANLETRYVEQSLRYAAERLQL